LLDLTMKTIDQSIFDIYIPQANLVSHAKVLSL